MTILLLSLLLGSHSFTIVITNPPVDYRIVIAEVTGYSSDSNQTDNTPYLTAWQTKAREGVIACPRYIPFGTLVEIDSKQYTCEDRMNLKWPERWDLWFSSKQKALNYGIKVKTIKIYDN